MNKKERNKIDKINKMILSINIRQKEIEELIALIEADITQGDSIEPTEYLNTPKRKKFDMDVFKHNEEYFDGYVEAYFHDGTFLGTYDEYLEFIEREKVEMERRRK